MKKSCLRIVLGLGLSFATISHARLLVGFDSANTTADIQAMGFSGTAVPSAQKGSQLGWSTVDTPAQSDGSGLYGNGDAAPTNNASWKSGSPVGACTAYIDFTIFNNSGAPVDLETIMFNGVRRNKDAMNKWAVSVVSGSITIGTVQSGTLRKAASLSIVGNNYQMYMIDLTGLADCTLDVGTSATFRILYTGGRKNVGKESYIDDVGISSSDEKISDNGQMKTLGLITF